MREYFFMYVVQYHSLNSGRVCQESSFTLFLAYIFLTPLLSFTLLLYGFLRRRVEEWDKVHQTGVLLAFWEFWRTNADGLLG